MSLLRDRQRRLHQKSLVKLPSELPIWAGVTNGGEYPEFLSFIPAIIEGL